MQSWCIVSVFCGEVFFWIWFGFLLRTKKSTSFLLPLTTLRDQEHLSSYFSGLDSDHLYIGFVSWTGGVFLSWLYIYFFNYLFGFVLAFLCFVWCFSSVWAEVFVSTAGVCPGLCNVSPFFTFSKMVNLSKQHIAPPMTWILTPWSLREPLKTCFK